jgi:hypothetical protein
MQADAPNGQTSAALLSTGVDRTLGASYQKKMTTKIVTTAPRTLSRIGRCFFTAG